MNMSFYPLFTMTYCFVQTPPLGSICDNCTKPPPGFNITFPVYPTTTIPNTDPDGGGIWPIIVAVIFGVVVVACIIAFIVWWMKKYGILAQCKVHPDSLTDEEKVTQDMTEVDTLGTEIPADPPPSGPPPGAAIGAAAAIGASPSVKRVYQKGSVELKPIGKPLPPIKTGGLILDPANLAEPETDRPQPLANSNTNNSSPQKPRKKKKKKKKKKMLPNDEEMGDTNLGYDNTEDVPDG